MGSGLTPMTFCPSSLVLAGAQPRDNAAQCLLFLSLLITLTLALRLVTAAGMGERMWRGVGCAGGMRMAHGGHWGWVMGIQVVPSIAGDESFRACPQGLAGTKTSGEMVLIELPLSRRHKSRFPALRASCGHPGVRAQDEFSFALI